MRWFLAIVGGFTIMLAMNSVLFYVAFNGGDTIAADYHHSADR